jgi:hypothetical protein
MRAIHDTAGTVSEPDIESVRSDHGNAGHTRERGNMGSTSHSSGGIRMSGSWRSQRNQFAIRSA